MSIEGVWEFTPLIRADDRGVFLESFKASQFDLAVGHPLRIEQMNVSVSRANTVRGLHFADVPPGQAKYVQCFAGRILDVVVDIRVGSPTFGTWDAVELDDTDRKGLYIAEGLGHPLLPPAKCVRNDIHLDDALRVLLVSGSNMSGKSTMLRLLCGIYQPDSGEIIVRDKIAPLVALGAGFHNDLSGYENIFLNDCFDIVFNLHLFN